MYSGRLVFAQVMDFMPINDFHKCVDRYHGNYKVQILVGLAFLIGNF